MFARSASRFVALASNAARTGSVTRRCVQYRNVCATAAASCSPADGVSVSKPSKLVPGREPLLFTPGPLTTSAPTKQAMLVDLGSRDSAFVQVVRDVRNGLLDMAGVSQVRVGCRHSSFVPRERLTRVHVCVLAGNVAPGRWLRVHYYARQRHIWSGVCPLLCCAT